MTSYIAPDGFQPQAELALRLAAMEAAGHPVASPDYAVDFGRLWGVRLATDAVEGTDDPAAVVVRLFAEEHREEFVTMDEMAVETTPSFVRLAAAAELAGGAR